MSDRASAAERVRNALTELGLDARIQELPDSTRTAEQAAQAVGMTVGQIVKSLVFMTDEEPLLVCASGANRVSIPKLDQLVEGTVRQASPDEVRSATGFAIGGVPPTGFARPLVTFIDRDLMQYEEICAAAGTPHAVFRTTPLDLQRMTDGAFADLKDG
ncbi:MAG: YbaK/EbsC family protein [Candidatus Bipolaricaulia bacterium]